MQAKRRLDYVASEFTIDSVSLNFELAPESTLVTNTMQVSRVDVNSTSELFLNGESLTFISASLIKDGVSTALIEDIDYRLGIDGLALLTLPSTCELVLVTQINPKANTALEGLYYASGAFCTQCEAEGFRRITYYLDRPDVLSIFTVTLNASKAEYPYLLSNGNPVAQGDLPDNRHFVTWFDPHKKPAYLFALVAGDFDLLEDVYLTNTDTEVTLQVFVEKGRQQQALHAMHSLKKSMRWDEQTFNLTYDLDIYMIVAVDFFNMGAMENKGLNIFNSKFVLADSGSATDEDYFNIESIIAHEYFHNWTGNRVTCRDWFQLSLKEGLTVYRDQWFSHDMTSPLSNRIKQVNVMRAQQFAEDASAMAHPIRPEEVIEMNNFYTVTVYDKGAEVIRMMHTLLGDDGFKHGLRLYFQRHDGQAVTCDDFVNAMADANDYDLTDFSLWYSQSGTPEVKVEQSYDPISSTLTVSLTQLTQPTQDQAVKAPLVLPIKYECVDKHGTQYRASNEHSDNLVVMDDAQLQITFKHVPADAIAVLFNGFSAPVKVQAHYTIEQYMQVIQHANDDFAKWEAIQSVYQHAVKRLLDGNVALNEAAEVHHYLSKHIKLEQLGSWLQASIDQPELLAEMLTLPSTDALLQRLHGYDILAIEQARIGIIEHLLTLFREDFVAQYRTIMQQPVVYAYEQQQVNARRLANVLIGLLAHDKQHAGLALEHVNHSDNMTNSLGGLKATQVLQGPEFVTVMDQFLAQWKNDAVVMDKWFALHATSNRPDILSQLTLLQGHPLYSINNPNKVRALMGSFAFYNVNGFHAADGSGYAYIANYLMELDSVNAQVAARIVTPLTQWQPHPAQRQAQMVKQLRRLLDHSGLSKDLFEKVSKSVMQYEALH